jgi:aspartyl protease/PDZ domain-containing protein
MHRDWLEEFRKQCERNLQRSVIERMRLKSQIILFILFASLLAVVTTAAYTPLPYLKSDQVTLQAAGKVARFPFELNGNMIFLPVRVNGSKPLSFGLDTGAYLSVINTPIVEQLGLKTAGRAVGFGAGGQVPSLQLPDVTLDISGATLKDLDLSGMALGSIENSLGRPMDGILGAEFFKRYVVELDYEKNEITLYEPADFVYSGNGESLPLTFYHNHPYIRAKVSLPGIKPVEGEFVIDAGSNFPIILLPSFIEGNNLRQSLPPTITTFGRGVGGEIRMPIGRASSLELGKLKLERLVTAFPSNGWFGEQGKAGNIGSAVLRRFKVIFDYSRNRMILEPNKFFPDVFEHDMSGLSLVTESPAFKVVRINRVLAQSPAEEAGIKQNDEIVSVNDRPAAEFKLVALREMLRQPGRTFSLQLKRGADILSVELKTRRLI